MRRSTLIQADRASALGVAVGLPRAAVALLGAVLAVLGVTLTLLVGAAVAQAQPASWTGSLTRSASDPSGDTLVLRLSPSEPTDSVLFGLNSPSYTVTSATLTASTGVGPIDMAGTNACQPDEGISPETPTGDPGVTCSFTAQQLTAVTITLRTSSCYSSLLGGGQVETAGNGESDIAGPTSPCPGPSCSAQRQAYNQADTSFDAARDLIIAKLSAVRDADRAVAHAVASARADVARPLSLASAIRKLARLARRRDAALPAVRRALSMLTRSRRALALASHVLAACEGAGASGATAPPNVGRAVGVARRLRALAPLVRQITRQPRTTAGELSMLRRDFSHLSAQLRGERARIAAAERALTGS